METTYWKNGHRLSVLEYIWTPLIEIYMDTTYMETNHLLLKIMETN